MIKKGTPRSTYKQTALKVIFDEITRNLLPDNNEYYIQHISGSLTVALKKELSTKKMNIISDNDEEDEVQITKKKPQHPRDRLRYYAPFKVRKFESLFYKILHVFKKL